MSGWYYRKSGTLEDSTVGPFDDAALLQLAFDGQLTSDTPVLHERSTRGQWVYLRQIPAAIKKISEGEAHRQAAKEFLRQQQAQVRAEQAQQQAEQASARRATYLQFLMDGQPEATVAKIHERVSELLTASEVIEYIAVQAKPIAIAPDCLTITNRRIIAFRQKILGQLDFQDCLWMYLFDARLKEGVLFSEVSFRITNGNVFSMDYLPKPQARKVYRIAQQREEEAIETRRNRAMEESRAGAANIVVNAPAVAPNIASAANADDPVVKLQKLKQMLDAGLIEQTEYNATKSRILAAM